MKFCAILLVIVITTDAILTKECSNKKLNSKLICYYSHIDVGKIPNCKCSHIVLPLKTDRATINKLRDTVQKSVKLLITINEFNQDVVDLLNSNQLDGIELNLKKLNSRDDINDFLSTIRQKFNNLLTLVTVPTKPEILAKFYDFKALSKYADGFVLQTSMLGMSKNITFHPSRLSGLWDMQNTDSVVDLVSGLGAPLSKLIITAPVQGFRFKLQNTKHTAPGSPALEVQTITRDELCKLMRNGKNWTLERDQDQAGPFIFSEDQWIAFDDPTSIDIKAKYSRIRGLAGMALKDLNQDGGAACESSLLDAAFDGLGRQARAPRGAVLHSLEREIRQTPHALDTIQVSPYRISRVIDVEGNIHAIRQDTRTEFACSRQGYFVHPRSCNRFYRCVKFDQLKDEFNVFEFDCPAGLVFDERVEVCVWPGNLEHGSPCAGSSEIAPVPREKFVCPTEPGYYADPENCRWFFACLDHGKSALAAYEFRCPFGLVFDESRLLCEWAWLVPRCASGYTTHSSVVYGHGGHGGVVSLEQYDGLGVLPVTKLGGLSGPLQEPVAQIYTNVGSGGIIANTDANGYKIISTNAGFGGLSANAALSLHNAGLLKTGQYNAFGVHGSGYQDAGKSQYLINGGIQSTYQDNAAALHNAHEAGGSYYANLEGSGKVSGGSVVLTDAQQNAHLINNLAHGTSAQTIDNTEFGAKSYQNIEQYYQQHANNEAELDQNNIKITGTLTHGTGVAGNINIVGGGYSAVGAFDRGVEISHNGVGSSTIAHVTPSPITITTLPSVPTVTTVPIPSLSTATSFQSYKGGVVANIPQLQYRIDGHNLQLQAGHSSGFSSSHQNVNVANISTNYVNLISSTPDYGSVGLVSTPATVIQEDKLVEIPAKSSYSYQNQHVATGFEGASLQTDNHQAKAITFIETQPDVKVQPTIQPVISVSNHHNYYAQVDTNTANLERKESFEGESKLEQPAVSVSTFEGYHYDRPAVQFGDKQFVKVQPVQTVVQPTVPVPLQPTVQAVIKQPTVAVPTFHGYHYQKPSVRFEEKPTLAQPAVSYQTFQTYSDNKASVAAQDQTRGKVESVGTVVNQYEEQPKVHQAVPTLVQPAISFQTYQSYSNNEAYAIAEQNAHKEAESWSTGSEGYTYQKPSLRFEAKPLIKVQPTVAQPAVSYQTYQTYSDNKASIAAQDQILGKVEAVGTVVKQYEEQPNVHQAVPTLVQPAVSFQTYQSYSNNKASAIAEENAHKEAESWSTVTEGYTYQKPSVQFEEKPLIKVQPTVAQPAVSYQTYQSYSNNKASAATENQAAGKVEAVGTVVAQYEEKPKVLQTVPTQVQPAVSFQTYQSYGNSKASANAEENAYQKSESWSSVAEQQPTVFEGYTYQRPSIQFEEKPLIKVQPTAASYQTFHSTNEASTNAEEKSEQYSTFEGYNYQKPLVQPTVPALVQPAVSFQTYTNYNNKASAISDEKVESVSNFEGYTYSKPSVQFEERPVIRFEEKPVVKVQPAVSFSTFQSYNNKESSASTEEKSFEKVASWNTVVEQQPITYSKPLVKVQPTVQTVVQPAVSYTTYQTFGNQKANIEDKGYAKTESLQTIVQQPVSTFQGYHYEKPAVQFEETPQGKIETPTAPAVSYSSYNTYNEQKTIVQPTVQPVVPVSSFQGYNNRKPSVVFEEKPQIYVSSTPAPVFSSTPAVVSSFSISSHGQDYAKPSVVLAPVQPVVQKTYISPQPSTFAFKKVIEDYTYSKQPTPAVVSVSTAKPAVVSSYSYTAPGYNYQQPESTGYVYDKPQIKFEEVPVPVTEVPFVKKTAYITGSQNEENKYKYNEEAAFVQNYQVSSTPRPIIDYTYVQSTPKPTFESVVLPAAKNPVTPKQFYYYDSRLSSTPQPEIKYASSTAAVPTVTVVSSTTSRPIAKYSFSSLDEIPATPVYKPIRQRVKITTPLPTELYTVPELSREYLPVATKFTVTTPAPEYLPVRIKSTTAVPIDEEVLITRRPAKVVKIVRPKTIIKQNDFNPLLTTKLGAQCTCVSNTLKLRKKPVRIIVETDEDDEDDGYVVGGSSEGQIIENYQYEPQKAIDVVPQFEVSTPKARVTDGEIAKAVRTGLKLVKEAVKDGTKEALESKSFDRYGPGGVRSRNERLQGTIDCQRAGLFRHPTECNKFYSCRWDCTKNRYTLHVFNCPVHLTFDNSLGACNWPSQGPACLENTLLPSD